MKSSMLLPHVCKQLGWWILIPSTILGIYVSSSGYEAGFLDGRIFAFFSDGNGLSDTSYFTFTETNLTATLAGVLFIVGGLMVGFSKEKQEDEFIARLRLSSLLWSVWVHYIILLLAFIFVYGLPFFTVMVYNMFTILIIFIIRFNYILFKNSKIVSYEE